MIITAIICTTIVVCFILNLMYEAKKPQNKCSHEMETIKVRDGERSTEYLSTCKKCGYQKRYLFKGVNL